MYGGEGRPLRYLKKQREKATCKLGKKESQAEGKGSTESLEGTAWLVRAPARRPQWLEPGGKWWTLLLELCFFPYEWDLRLMDSFWGEAYYALVPVWKTDWMEGHDRNRWNIIISCRTFLYDLAGYKTVIMESNKILMGQLHSSKDSICCYQFCIINTAQTLLQMHIDVRSGVWIEQHNYVMLSHLLDTRI